MFHVLGVALYCLLGACPVFVACTGRETSSPYIDKPGILTPIFRSISGVHIRIVQQLLPVPFRSGPECSGFSSIPVLQALSTSYTFTSASCSPAVVTLTLNVSQLHLDSKRLSKHGTPQGFFPAPNKAQLRF